MNELERTEIKRKLYEKGKPTLRVCSMTGTALNVEVEALNHSVLARIIKQELGMLEQKVRKQRRQTSIIRCSCGNVIRMFNDKNSVKCFKCNHWFDKINNEWERQEATTSRDTLTIGDIQLKRRKK